MVQDLIQTPLYTKRGGKRIKQWLEMNAKKHAKSRSRWQVSGEKGPILPAKHARHATRRTASVGNNSQTPNRSVSTGPLMKPPHKKNRCRKPM